MNTLLLKIGATALLALALFAGVRYVRGLRADLALAQQTVRDSQREIDARERAITALKADAAEKAEQQKRLDAVRSTLDAKQTRIHAETRRIIHESPENRAWADTVLPADVARLQTSPALAGSGDYLQRVPDGDAVSPIGNGPGDERRPE